VPVGHGQVRRGWVVTAELCWSRVIAGALIFSKEAPDILWGVDRCLSRIGALPEKLVWDREGAIAPAGRPTDQFAGFCGQLGVGWIILDAGDAQAKYGGWIGAVRFSAYLRSVRLGSAPWSSSSCNLGSAGLDQGPSRAAGMTAMPSGRR
jgi:hypothetical protein